MRKALVLIFGLGLAALLSACASGPVTKLEPVIVPQQANLAQARMGIFAFRTPWNERVLESQLAQRFHQLMLARRLGRIIEVIPEGYRDQGEALDRARILGYDVAVLGQVQEAFYGGDVAPSRATVDVRVVDVVRRLTIWYLSSSAQAAPNAPADYLLWRSDGAQAESPIYLIHGLLAQVADKMATARPQLQASGPKPVPPSQAAKPNGPVKPPDQAPESDSRN
jgi:hypothetical protein